MEELKFFDALSQKFIYSNNEKNNKSIHNEIEKDKQNILNYYRNEPAYKDKIDNMELKSRGKFYYKSLVKKQIQKKSNFIKIILKSISQIEEKSKKKNKSLNHRYYLPMLESVRNKKMKIDTRLKSREKSEENIKEKIMLSSEKRILDNFNENKLNPKIMISKNKSRILSGIRDNNKNNFSSPNKNISHSFSLNSIRSYNKEARLEKFNGILYKCQKGIKKGDLIGGRVEKFTKKFNKDLTRLKEKRENKVDNNIEDQKIVEDKVKEKQKYKLLEIEKFKELKRRLNIKISDNYVYFNRKEYSELASEQRNEKEFELYYEDINKINEEIRQKRIKEKNKFYEIKNLLEDSYKKKDYLKNKILLYNKNRIIEHQIEKDMEKKNMKFLFEEESNIKNNNGNLVHILLKNKYQNKNQIKSI